MLSDAMMSPWHWATLHIKDAVAGLSYYLKNKVLYTGHVHFVIQKSGMGYIQKNTWKKGEKVTLNVLTTNIMYQKLYPNNCLFIIFVTSLLQEKTSNDECFHSIVL